MLRHFPLLKMTPSQNSQDKKEFENVFSGDFKSRTAERAKMF